MKRIFNLKSGLLFMITAGLPILGMVGGLGLEIFLIEQSNGTGHYSSDLGVNIFMGSGLVGFLTFHLWALTAGISLSSKDNTLRLNRWAMLTFGMLSLLVLLYITIESLYIILNITIATESSAGLSAIQTSTSAIIAFGLIFGVWFLPRILFFSYLAILLCHQEGNNRWISTAFQFFFWPVGVWFLQPRLRRVLLGTVDRAIEDHLVNQ